MYFKMTDEALPTLNKQTGASHQDIGSLIKDLIASVAPLEGKFDGDGYVQFQNFKLNADQITVDLQNAFGAVGEGQAGMHTAFVTGTDEMVTNARTTEGSADYSTAIFHGA